jgi:hypothetical protein
VKASYHAADRSAEFDEEMKPREVNLLASRQEPKTSNCISQPARHPQGEELKCDAMLGYRVLLPAWSPVVPRKRVPQMEPCKEKVEKA